VIIVAQLFNMLLTVSSPESYMLGVYDDGWWYDDFESAVRGLNEWNGEGEPEGWYRHRKTGRRRPGGDPDKEYINF
jgi:hypothetical protein